MRVFSSEDKTRISVFLLISILLIQLLPEIELFKFLDVRMLIVVHLLISLFFLALQGKDEITNVLVKYFTVSNKVYLSFLLFFIGALVTAMLSNYMFKSIYRLLIVYFDVISIFYMSVSIKDKKMLIKYLTISLIVLGIISSIYSYILSTFGNQYFLDDGYQYLKLNIFNLDLIQVTVGRRPSSFYRNPNFYAIILVLSIFSTLMHSIFSKNYCILPLLLLLVYSLLTTKSRSALLLLFCYIGILLVYYFRNNLKVLLFIGIIMGTAAFYLYKTIFIGRNIGQSSGRAEIWFNVLKSFIKKPLLGYGFGISIESLGIEGGLSTHNIYIKLLYETGVIGFTMFINIIYQSLKVISDKLRKSSSQFYIMLFPLFIAFLFHQFFESTLFVYNCLMSVWVVLLTLLVFTDSEDFNNE